MAVDSADDRDVFYSSNGGTGEDKPLAEYLPQSRNGSILVTTRDKDLARRLTGDHKSIIEVGTMVPSDALLLFENKFGLLSDSDSAAELVQALDYFPLAISQAASYIQKMTPRSSVGKYLAKFRAGERKKIRLLGHDSGDLRRDGSASNAILTTWQISFQHIRTKRRSAADLLSLMSFFDRQGIPEALLKSSRYHQNAAQQRGRSELEDAGSNGSDSESDDTFEDDIAILRDYCLIIPNDDGDVFEMHGLVQLSTRKWLEARKLQEKFKQQFVSLMAASFPEADYANLMRCQSLFAHVEAAMDFRPADNRLEIAWATLLCNGGWYAKLQGKYNIAEQMLCEAGRSYKRILGKENRATLKSTSLFASVLLDKGLWGKAEKLLVQVTETSKTKLGADHPDTLTSIANLALTYRNQGRWEEAEKLLVQVIETSKAKLGADHPDTLTSIANLATTFWHQGRWEEVEKLDIQVMETIKAKLGADHPDTLTNIANLATTFWNQGRQLSSNAQEPGTVGGGGEAGCTGDGDEQDKAWG
ncbi:hypothetical protein OIDMADRAFT_148058 [Oidiodendron maius Zn]|uniref:NB-ARC domain-containing protein n=1 Tax=Oidiodendron maius (strain Zn) TaxID=913774 RepID=A0A0C3D4J8_OIDMZ|nr:hypothetical protein OIDMADRAFT_148058 [Oidiodendron maius Zn]